MKVVFQGESVEMPFCQLEGNEELAPVMIQILEGIVVEELPNGICNYLSDKRFAAGVKDEEATAAIRLEVALLKLGGYVYLPSYVAAQTLTRTGNLFANKKGDFGYETRKFWVEKQIAVLKGEEV